MPEGSIDISGTGNFVASEVSNSTINASIVIGKSGEYRELKDHLDTLQKLFDKTPENETQERLELSEKINKQKAFLESFKQDVLRLAETFDKIELNTECLQKAKEHFANGEITEARVLLEVGEEERADAVKRALVKQKESAEVLQNAATEYLLLAQTTALDFNNPNRFEHTCHYYEQSIRANAFFSNVFNYAKLLQEHNQFQLAESYYQRVLNEFWDSIAVQNYAATLHNLAAVHYVRGDLQTAENEYGKALKIYRSLTDEKPGLYLQDVAMTLNSLAVLHHYCNNYEIAEKEFTEALEIYQILDEISDQEFLPDIVMTLNNLGILHNDRNEFYEAETKYAEALGISRGLVVTENLRAFLLLTMTLNNLANLHTNLGENETAESEFKETLLIYQKLAEKNPQAHLQDVAMTLNNLGVLYDRLNKYEAAEAEHIKALNIRQELVERDPKVYLPDVATSLNNLAILHNAQKKYELAEKEYLKALEIRRKLADQSPQVFEIHLAQTLYNLVFFYNEINEFSTMDRCLKETIEILEKYVDRVPYVRAYLEEAEKVLQNRNKL